MQGFGRFRVVLFAAAAVLVLALGLIPMTCPVVHAQAAGTPEEQARALIELARAQLDLGCADCSPSRALDLARQSHGLHPSALALQYIAIAEKRLSRYLESEQHLLEALAFTGGPPLSESERAAALRTIEDVREHLVDLTIDCPLPGGEVFVNDRARGRLDQDGHFAIRLQRGVYDLRIVLEGHPTLNRRGVEALQAAVGVTMDTTTDTMTAAIDEEALRAQLDAQVEERLAQERAAVLQLTSDERAAAMERERSAAFQLELDQALAGNQRRVQKRRRGWSFATAGMLLVGIGVTRFMLTLDADDDEGYSSYTNYDARIISSSTLMGAGALIWLISFPIAVRARALPLPDGPRAPPPLTNIRCGMVGATFVGCSGSF